MFFWPIVFAIGAIVVIMASIVASIEISRSRTSEILNYFVDHKRLQTSIWELEKDCKLECSISFWDDDEEIATEWDLYQSRLKADELSRQVNEKLEKERAEKVRQQREEDKWWEDVGMMNPLGLSPGYSLFISASDINWTRKYAEEARRRHKQLEETGSYSHSSVKGS